mgnify:CR=1 FL=1
MTSGLSVYMEKFTVQSAPQKEVPVKNLKQIAQAAVRAHKERDVEFLVETLNAMEIELQRLMDRECAERLEREQARSED